VGEVANRKKKGKLPIEKNAKAKLSGFRCLPNLLGRKATAELENEEGEIGSSPTGGAGKQGDPASRGDQRKTPVLHGVCVRVRQKQGKSPCGQGTQKNHWDLTH